MSSERFVIPWLEESSDCKILTTAAATLELHPQELDCCSAKQRESHGASFILLSSRNNSYVLYLVWFCSFSDFSPVSNRASPACVHVSLCGPIPAVCLWIALFSVFSTFGCLPLLVRIPIMCRVYFHFICVVFIQAPLTCDC